MQRGQNLCIPTLKLRHWAVIIIFHTGPNLHDTVLQHKGKIQSNFGRERWTFQSSGAVCCQLAECLGGISGPAGLWQRWMWEAGQALLPCSENHYKYKPAWRLGAAGTQQHSHVSITERWRWTPQGVRDDHWDTGFFNTKLGVTRLVNTAPVHVDYEAIVWRSGPGRRRSEV